MPSRDAIIQALEEELKGRDIKKPICLAHTHVAIKHPEAMLICASFAVTV